MEWLEQLKQHRLYRQHVLSVKDLDSSVEDAVSPSAPSGEGKDIDKELNLIEKDLSNLQGIFDSIPHSTNSRDTKHKDKDDDNNKRDFCVLAKEGEFLGLSAFTLSKFSYFFFNCQ
jgi:hypothetical protein